MKARRFRPALASAVLGVLLGQGCGDDEEEVAAPRAPPTLRIAELRAGDGRSWLRENDAGSVSDPVHTSCDPERSVGVRVAITDFDVRPPKACGSSSRCGSVRLEVEGPSGRLAVEGSSPWIEARLGRGFQPGPHRFRVELRRNGEPIAVGGGVLSDEVSVTLAAPLDCGAGDAGTDAELDAPLDAGSDATNDAPEPDSTTDAEPDSAPDAPDAPPDAADAPSDAGSDAGETGADSAADAPGDTSLDGP